MSSPAAVLGDSVRGTCLTHQMPNPATGLPQPTGPLPFDAPLTVGLASSVLVGGRPAAVRGSSGFATPPHVGLHATDPSVSPTNQRGEVVTGSTSVLIEGSPAATAASACTSCGVNPATLSASAVDVLVGA